jgi:hypothetical protein
MYHIQYRMAKKYPPAGSKPKQSKLTKSEDVISMKPYINDMSKQSQESVKWVGHS